MIDWPEELGPAPPALAALQVVVWTNAGKVFDSCLMYTARDADAAIASLIDRLVEVEAERDDYKESNETWLEVAARVGRELGMVPAHAIARAPERIRALRREHDTRLVECMEQRSRAELAEAEVARLEKDDALTTETLGYAQERLLQLEAEAARLEWIATHDVARDFDAQLVVFNRNKDKVDALAARYEEAHR